MTKSDLYQIQFKGMTPGGDLKKVALAVARIKRIAPNEALEKIKNEHFSLHSSLTDTQSDKLYKLMRSYGANVTLTKVKNYEEAQFESDRPLPRRRIHALFVTLMLFIVLLTSFLLLVRLAGQHSLDEENETVLQKAKSLIVGKKVYTAPDFINEAIELIEQSKSRLQKTSWSGYGQKAPNQGGNIPQSEFEKAFSFLDRAEKMSPQEERVDQWRAQLYDLDGQTLKAEKAYKQGIRKNPDNVYLRNDYAAFLTEQERFEGAERQYLQALGREPKNPETHKNLGALYQFYLKDSARAREHYYDYAKHADPKDIQRYLVMRELSSISYYTYEPQRYPKKGKTQLGFDTYEARRLDIQRRIQKDPKDPRLSEAQGILYAQRGMHDVALQSLKKAKDLDSKRASVYKERARIFMALENVEQAYRELVEGEKRADVDAELIGQLALFEKYYRYDTTRVSELGKKYLSLGGNKEPLIRDLLDQEGLGRASIKKEVIKVP